MSAAAGAFGSLAASPFHPSEHLPDHEALLADLGPLLHMAGCWLDPLCLLWLEELFRRVQDEGAGEKRGFEKSTLFLFQVPPNELKDDISLDGFEKKKSKSKSSSKIDLEMYE